MFYNHCLSASSKQASACELQLVVGKMSDVECVNGVSSWCEFVGVNRACKPFCNSDLGECYPVWLKTRCSRLSLLLLLQL